SVISNPGDLNKIAPNIKSKNFDNFFESVIKSALPNESIPPIRTEIKLGGGGVLKTSFRDVAKNRAYLMDRLKAEREDIYKALSKTLSSRETGLGFTPEVEEIVQPTP
ncbi:MAG: hypothetical protein HYZ69_01625, partial [Candidatus Colwellbacteria bacterium]|nr:hypothetical protein [Candidatus Colwellbacteria bacterium]